MDDNSRTYKTFRKLIVPRQEPPPERIPINAIRICHLGNDEVLVSVDDEGLVMVWFTENFDRQPLSFKNNISTWGIATHAPSRLLAVSANSHQITLFDVSHQGVEHSLEDRELISRVDRKELSGHLHNVPSIDFHENGRFLASCSIDGTCRVWEVATGKTLRIIYGKELKWNWAIKFLPTKYLITSLGQDSKLDHVPPLITSTTPPPSSDFNWMEAFGEDEDDFDYDSDMDENVDDEDSDMDDDVSDYESDGHDQDDRQYIMESSITIPFFGDHETDDYVSANENAVEEDLLSMEADESSLWTDDDEDEDEETMKVFQEKADQSPQERIEFEDNILMYTTKRDIHLVDPETGEYYDSITDLIRRSDLDPHSWHFDRLCMVEFVKEFSLLLVGTQAGRIALVRVVRSQSDTTQLRYKMVSTLILLRPISGNRNS
ncbi:hypothetical protein HDU67_005992 [Dinochytrium kinnereticum]|nr:hypothetical protein HDU67_005992 [Dinochytrium kinnereticum]